MSWDLKPCGTDAAYKRHLRRGEKPCEPCTVANRLRNAERKGCQPSAVTPDYREVRNGLPEFVPYVYRGTGEDAMAGAA